MATCKAVLGQKKYQHREWITEKSLQLVKIRKKRKAALKSGRTQTERAKPRDYNTETNKKTKISLQEDKRVQFSA